jgi:hypothetical protein
MNKRQKLIKCLKIFRYVRRVIKICMLSAGILDLIYLCIGHTMKHNPYVALTAYAGMFIIYAWCLPELEKICRTRIKKEK